MQIKRKQLGGLVLGCLVVLTLAVSGLMVRAKSRQSTKDRRAAISADQAIACVRTAVAAKPGDVRAMETENEGGKVICEIEVLAQDGKTYEVEVDVESNTVTEVEEDND